MALWKPGASRFAEVGGEIDLGIVDQQGRGIRMVTADGPDSGSENQGRVLAFEGRDQIGGRTGSAHRGIGGQGRRADTGMRACQVGTGRTGQPDPPHRQQTFLVRGFER